MLYRFTQSYVTLLLQIFHLCPCRIPPSHHAYESLVLLPEPEHILGFILARPDPGNQLFIVHHIRHLPKTPQTQGENARGAFIEI